jgi:hypothetical protein
VRWGPGDDAGSYTLLDWRCDAAAAPATGSRKSTLKANVSTGSVTWDAALTRHQLDSGRLFGLEAFARRLAVSKVSSKCGSSQPRIRSAAPECLLYGWSNTT